MKLLYVTLSFHLLGASYAETASSALSYTSPKSQTSSTLPPSLSKSQASASPSETPSFNIDPCARLGSIKPDAISNGLYYYRPSMILDCFKAVPMDSAAALNLTSYVSSIAEWHSTLAYLKNPTPSYHWPAVDVLGELQTIQKNIQSNKYSNFWDFEIDIQKVTWAIHDEHFYLATPLVSWGKVLREPLTSVSMDGKALPQVYFAGDLQGSYTPSPIVSVNGQKIDDYLLNFPLNDVGLQDKDATYNTMLFNPGSYQGSSNAFASSHSTSLTDFDTFTFQNGSSINMPNSYVIGKDFQGLQSGSDLLKRNILMATQDNAQNSKSVKKKRSGNLAPGDPSALSKSLFGFPPVVFNSTDGVVSGYFLSDQPNTAVLHISSFTTNFQASFQETVASFLAQCRQAGKNKLIVDVRGNPGGRVLLGVDTFKQIFPTQQPYTKLRMRAHPAMNTLGNIISTFEVPDVQTQLDSPNSPRLVAATNYLNAKLALKTPDGESYDSWSAFYGPQKFNGDLFSNYFSYDFPSENENFAFGRVDVSGYGNRTDMPDQVFPSESITLLTDGACGSTCSVFSNLMIHSGNVSTVVMGGRPATDKMAIIGGTQGANDLGSTDVVDFVRSIPAEQGKALPESQIQMLRSLLNVPQVQRFQMNFNFLDQLLPKSGDVPLQFTSTMSDCRVFYTANDVWDITSTWNKISSGSFSCVDGGSKPGKRLNSATTTSIVSVSTQSSLPINQQINPVKAIGNAGSFIQMPTFSLVLAGMVSFLFL